MTEPRRNQYGQYSVPGTNGKPLGYARVTTVAKTLDDGGGLIPWKATLAMTGLMRRPGLRGRFEALMTEWPNPWYGSADSKKEAKKLVEECAEAGGSSDRADQGTALHAIFEQYDLRGDVWPSQETTMADLKAYVAAINAAGITYDRDYIEAVVILDEYRVAGTSDRLVCHVPGYELPLVGEAKTGADLRYSWQSIAVQLAAYANANAVYRYGEAADGSQDERLPMPAVDLEHGLVIHSPAEEARCDLYIVDIAAGWEAFQMSMQTRKWRSRKNLAKQLVPSAMAPFTPEGSSASVTPGRVAVASTSADKSGEEEPPTAPPTTTGENDEWTTSKATRLGSSKPEATSALLSNSVTPDSTTEPVKQSLGQETCSPTSSTTQPADPFDGLVDGYVAEPADPERRAWVIRRLGVLQGIDGALAAVGQRWPEGLATLKHSDRHTDTDLDRIVAVLNHIEAQFTVPFGEKDPTWTTPLPDDSTVTSPSHRVFSKTSTSTLRTTTATASSPPCTSSIDSSTTCSTDTTPTRSEDDEWTAPTLSPTSISEKPSTTSWESKGSPTNSGLMAPTETTSSDGSPAPATTSTKSSDSSPDEGGPADPDAVTALQDAYGQLPAEGRSWIAGLARDAQHAGRPFDLFTAKTVRRFEIVRGLVTLAQGGNDKDDVVRGLLVAAGIDAVYTGSLFALGEALAALTADGALRFARLCDALTNGDLVATVTDAGHLQFAMA